MLLTSISVGRSKKRLWAVVQRYLARWRVEEVIRFMKQSYGFEDVRLLTYERLRSMAVLVMAAAHSLCVRLGQASKLRILARTVLQASRRISDTDAFRFYGLADGPRQLLYGRRLPRRGPATAYPPLAPPSGRDRVLGKVHRTRPLTLQYDMLSWQDRWRVGRNRADIVPPVVAQPLVCKSGPGLGLGSTQAGVPA